jgi:hypothetical protein
VSTAEIFAPRSMPSVAASISIHYPKFVRTDLPSGSAASSAWEGIIQPFMREADAKTFLHLIEQDKPFGVSEGTIICEEDSSMPGGHWADPYLVDMDTKFRVLVLSFDPPVHPRAYLLSPEFSSAFLSHHPHSRGDLEILFRDRRLAGLCVYSAAEFRFPGLVERIVEYLDQVSAWIGRHLIWLRTRRLYRLAPGGPELVYSPRPGEMVVDTEVGVRNAAIASIVPRERCFWNGYWPGKSARATGKDHLRLLDPSGECWCGSGSAYAACHRPTEELIYR